MESNNSEQTKLLNIWQSMFDELSKSDLFNLLIECTKQNENLKESLKEIESLTRNPREYEPSYYTINHIARTSLNNIKE